MNAGSLDTTNLLLGIMAAVSLIEAIVLIAVGVMGYRLYTQVSRTVRELEARHVAPLAAKVDTMMMKVDGILVDVKQITERVGNQTERVDSAIRHTMDRVDQTADRVRSTVSARVNGFISIVNSAWNLVGSMVNGRRSSGEAPGHTSVS
jgi:methyl-accepting chemotaxis protein